MHTCHFPVWLAKNSKVESIWIQVAICIRSRCTQTQCTLAWLLSSSGSLWATQLPVTLLPALKNTIFKTNSRRIYTYGPGTSMSGKKKKKCLQTSGSLSSRTKLAQARKPPLGRMGRSRQSQGQGSLISIPAFSPSWRFILKMKYSRSNTKIFSNV